MNLPDSQLNTVESIFSRYRDFLNSRNYSTPTVKNYLSDLRHLSNWMEGKFQIFGFDKITDTNISQYRTDVKDIFKAKPTIAARRLSSLKIFVGWAVSQKLLPKEILKTLENVKNEKDDLAVIGRFRTYLLSAGFSKPTIKNYLSDLRQLIDWIASNYDQFQFSAITEESVRNYRFHLKDRFRTKPSISARRLSSLRKFLAWAGKNNLVADELLRSIQKALEEPTRKTIVPLVPPAPINIVQPPTLTTPAPIDISNYKLHQKAIHHIKNTRPEWYRNYHKKDWASTLHTVIMVLLFVTVGSLIIYTEIIKPELEQTKIGINEKLGSVLAAASPPSVLSFQGRLTDSSDVPVTASSDIIFTIYDDETGGTLKWTSKTWSLAPDQNGIFSVCLGNIGTTDECLKEVGDSPDSYQADTAFPATLFSDNAALYLQISVEGETLTPRQRISSVAYALNSDALEGFHGSQTPGANQVPILDGSGNLAFAGATTISTGGSTALLLNPTGNLQFQSASNYIDASGNLVLAGTLTAGGGTSAIGSGGNDFSFDTTTGPTYSGTARISKTITLAPEYSGAILSDYYGAGTDTNITGFMTSDTDTSQGTSIRTYYEWYSSETAAQHYYTVAVRITLPKDFSAWATSNALVVNYITESATTTQSDLDVRIYNENSATIVASDLDNSSVSWATAVIDDSVLDDGASSEWDAADEVAVVYLRMGSQDDDFVRIGAIELNYLAKF